MKAKEAEWDVSRVRFREVYKMVLFPFRGLAILILLESFLLGIIATWQMALIILSIAFLGVFGSFAVHEYFHILALKGYGIRLVRVQSSLLRISIIPEEALEGGKLVLFSVAGPGACMIVGGLLYVLGGVCNIETCKIVAVIYLFHIVNLFPLLGDGRMVVKGLLTRKI
ncbi:MAG: hypothetical protein LUE63_06325 [Lachnospiraceae bacterium]|nr:hypothetical protein [Lachnospiraceae bacterium]